MSNRRQFITLLGGAAAWPLAAPAQQSERARQIAILSDFPESQMQPLIKAFCQRLQQLGWGEGSIEIHSQLTTGASAKFEAASTALIGMSPDMIVTLGSPALRAVRQQTRTIPVVFTFVADPVVQGFIESLARPGGNVTGFTNFEFAFAGKWLEALKEIRPQVLEVLMLVNPDNPGTVGLSRFITSIAPTYAIELVSASVRAAADIERAIVSFQHAINRGIIILPDGLPVIHRDLIIEVVNRSRLPAVFPFRTFPINGGLMSWGTDFLEIYRQAGTYVDRILRGAKPNDLPVQAPTKFELVINLKTAKALELSFPPTLLALADEVIE